MHVRDIYFLFIRCQEEKSELAKVNIFQGLAFSREKPSPGGLTFLALNSDSSILWKLGSHALFML